MWIVTTVYNNLAQDYPFFKISCLFPLFQGVHTYQLSLVLPPSPFPHPPVGEAGMHSQSVIQSISQPVCPLSASISSHTPSPSLTQTLATVTMQYLIMCHLHDYSTSIDYHSFISFSCHLGSFIAIQQLSLHLFVHFAFIFHCIQELHWQFLHSLPFFLHLCYCCHYEIYFCSCY